MIDERKKIHLKTREFALKWINDYPTKGFNYKGDLVPFLARNFETSVLMANYNSHVAEINKLVKEGILQVYKAVPTNYDNSSNGRKKRIVKHFKKFDNNSKENKTNEIEDLKKEINDLKNAFNNFVSIISKKRKEVS